MEAIILVTQRQEKDFHRKAAEFSLPVREEGSSCPAGKFYIVSYSHAAELFMLGISVGVNEGLSSAHLPEKALQN